jgi:hypothetical protein
MMPTPLDEVQLKDWAERNFERAWERRGAFTVERRKHISRHDFRAGYVAALVDCRVAAAFKNPSEVGL